MAEENTSKPEAETPTPVPETTPVTPVETTPAPAETPTTPPAQAPVPVHGGPANGLAIASLITGIVAILSGWVPVWGVLVGAAAVVLGILGLKKPNGKGMAIAGLITGGIGALWALIVTVFFIIAIAISATASNSVYEAVEQQNKDTQSLVEAKKDFAKGETAIFGDKYEVKVNSVEANYNPGQYYVAEDGKEYIRVNVSVKNISDESEYLMPYDFSIVDNGLAVTSSYAPSDKELESGDLNAGATTTGNIVYEVTKGATGLKIQYDVTVFDESYTSKKLTYTLAI